jgi:hypothetical protein
MKTKQPTYDPLCQIFLIPREARINNLKFLEKLKEVLAPGLHSFFILIQLCADGFWGIKYQKVSANINLFNASNFKICLCQKKLYRIGI